MSHEHRQHPERFYDDEGEAYEPFEWFDRPGRPGPGDEAQPWELG